MSTYQPGNIIYLLSNTQFKKKVWTVSIFGKRKVRKLEKSGAREKWYPDDTHQAAGRHGRPGILYFISFVEKLERGFDLGTDLSSVAGLDVVLCYLLEKSYSSRQAEQGHQIYHRGENFKAVGMFYIERPFLMFVFAQI